MESIASYRIAGRQSVDILKVAGYKISALDVEATVLAHPLVAEVAVVGVDDVDFGQRIAAIVVLQPPNASTHTANGDANRRIDGSNAKNANRTCTDVDNSMALTLPMLREWCMDRAAKYKAPAELWIVGAIPRNAMGKVNKKTLVALLIQDGHGPEPTNRDFVS
jgi:malonyl-CoA/methylmalonyl-CoA synthetase